MEQWWPSLDIDCKWKPKSDIVFCVSHTKVLSLVSAALTGQIQSRCRSHRITPALILGLSAVVGLLKRANSAARRFSLSLPARSDLSCLESIFSSDK